METASFMGLIKTIFYFVIAYFIIKLLVRLFFPMILRKVVSKAEQSFKKQYQTQQQHYTSQQNHSTRDEILSDTATSNNPKSTKKVGEYVDYEEIE